jgi:hypothetical protein
MAEVKVQYDKNHVLAEIKRIAKERGGLPPGSQRFYADTGIKKHEWERYWARWGDALIEAGFSPNRWNDEGYNSDFLLEKLAALARELGHFPTNREIGLKTRSDASFPSQGPFRKLGSKETLAGKLLEYCKARSGYEDVVPFCALLLEQKPEAARTSAEQETYGYVYLFKSGRY